MPTVTGTVFTPDGDELPDAEIEFILDGSPEISGGAVSVESIVTARTDENGDFTVTLLAGDYRVVWSGVDRSAIRVPSVPGTYPIGSITFTTAELSRDYGLLTQPVAWSEDLGGIA